MSIILPPDLPAAQTLREEGVEVLDGHRALDLRPLRIGLLNLMPNKPAVEAQIGRLLGAGRYPVELTLIVPESYTPTTTPTAHLRAFYQPWPSVRDRRFDGLVVTGAPVETLAFERVTYWRELRRIFDWAQDHTGGVLAICWAAQAALHHFHGLPKHLLPKKRFGVFRQRILLPDAPLLCGFGPEFAAPVSRRAEVRAADLPGDVEVLAASEESGLCLVEDRTLGLTAMFDHLEYDADTLRAEFLRDREAGASVAVPRNYFPNDDQGQTPANTWQPYARGLFGNWLAKIERHARRDCPVDRLVTWMLERPEAQLPAGDGAAALLVRIRRQPGAPAVVHCVLASLGVSVHHEFEQLSDGASRLLEFRVAPLPAKAAGAVLRTLLLQDVVLGAAHRASGAASGELLVQQQMRSARLDVTSDPARDADRFCTVSRVRAEAHGLEDPPLPRARPAKAA